ncbi:pectin lyase-like protein [Ceratobasidium sp. AG-I]|nr:pectin lyase-like protein [Ceratobasidium sp. AG-I]
MRSFSSILAVCITAFSIVPGSLGLYSPPSGSITVGGTSGKYSTLAAALKDTSSNVYFVYSGIYTGQVVITRANIKIYGQTGSALDYNHNLVDFTDNVTAAAAGGDEQSATIRVQATGVSFYNLNIINSYGTSALHTQAIALSVESGQFACYVCQIRGYQDTLLAEDGAQYYSKSLIEGAVDFIFGQRAAAWITASTITTLGSGHITASGRSSADTSYYVINNSTINGTGTQYLGRPWGDYARVIVQNSNIGSNIAAAGWTQWSTATPNTGHILFGEYNNNGAGAWNSARASFATKLSAGVSITTVLGSTSWIDSSFL